MQINHQMPTNRLKAALQAGQQQLGLWHCLPDPFVAELVAGSGADWVLIDGEHGPVGVEGIKSLLMAVEHGGAAPVVRALCNDAQQIKQLLDIGVMSLMVPNICNAQEARQCVDSVRYPPNGSRGVASGVVRASRYGRWQDYVQRVDREFCLILQAETREAMRNLDNILAVPGVDAIFFGPADLAADMGLTGQPGHADVIEAIKTGIAQTKQAGKAAGVISVVPDQVMTYIESGATLTAVGLDAHLLARATEAAIQTIQQRQAAFAQTT